MLQNNHLNILSAVDIRAVDKNALADVSGFQFDTGLSKEERAAQIIALTGNPYCFRYGDTAVKLEFENDGPCLHDVMSGLLIRQKSGL